MVSESDLEAAKSLTATVKSTAYATMIINTVVTAATSGPVQVILEQVK